jgi:hypothetical protein
VTLRVTQISDTHLSAKRAWSVPNFEAVLRHLAADPPDLVVNTGDIILDDPDDADDAAFAHSLHEQIEAPWVAVPGNHDIGDNGVAPWQGQRPTEERLERFIRQWGADRFAVDADGWRLLGCNNLLVGTGLPAETEQEDWLREQLAGADRVALFVHKPICLTDPEVDDGAGGPLELPERLRFWSLLQGSSVRLVASGATRPASCREASPRCGHRRLPSSAGTGTTGPSATPGSWSTSSTGTRSATGSWCPTGCATSPSPS